VLLVERASLPLGLRPERKAAVRTWAVENPIEIPERRKAGLEIDTKPVRPVLHTPDEKRPATSGTRRRAEDQKPSNYDHYDTDSRQKFLRNHRRK